MNWMLLPSLILGLVSSVSNAETKSETIASGNAILTAKTIQKITKQVIIKSLQKTIDARNGTNGLKIETEASQHSLQIPESALLKEILRNLGIQNELSIEIDPIQTSINFGPESFQIDVIKKDNNLFKIHAHWEIKEIKSESSSLKIRVPKGIFDRPFTITSSPVKIAMIANKGPISAELNLTAKLTDEGSTFELNSFSTNLDDHRSRLQMQLGLLTTAGRPLELEIITNGKTIKTDERTIRSELKKFESQITTIVQKKLAKIIRQEFAIISQKLEKEEPFKIPFDTNEILNRYSYKSDVADSLLRNISGDFLFSYIQELPKQNLFSTQASTHLCIDSTCLSNTAKTTDITTEDLTALGSDDGGIILYESWLQNIINAAPFQKRIRKYYKTSINIPGIDLGKLGIRIHFNPKRNSIAAVINLKIDIKETSDASKAMDSWAAFLSYGKKQVADWWEQLAGSGAYVIVPVELNFILKQASIDKTGKHFIEVVTEYPFSKKGTITNTYQYPSNVHEMNSGIRTELLNAIQAQIKNAIPRSIHISTGEPIRFNGLEFFINQAKITKNKGLLISGSIP